MLVQLDAIASLYDRLKQVLDAIEQPLTLTEKLLISHAVSGTELAAVKQGYIDLNPDRVCMQDATAQMALLQFMQSGRAQTAVPTTVHCDHLILAEHGAQADLQRAIESNREVYQFLEQVSDRYGIGFWRPGAGIIHQVVLENYAFPGGVMIGTDSHTVNAGGLGMFAVGVGGADAVDVMTGLPWELKFPKIIGVHLTGQFPSESWTSPKDVILYLAGLLTAKGGTNAVIEYFGPGAESLSCTGKGTICNMGAEIGATTSVFPFDASMADYLTQTNRAPIAELATQYQQYFKPDPAVLDNPDQYYDQVIEINLSTLEPHINGPFTPDLAWPLSKFADAVTANAYPEALSVGLVGSCTNSSYEDLSRAHRVAKAAVDAGLKAQCEFTITPGSEMIRATAERDGLLDTFRQMGAVVLANACGPCIGQWKRHDATEKNSIITSFNRNFAKRNDGNPLTHAFVSSPEMVTAMVLGGRLTFNPAADTLTTPSGDAIYLPAPSGDIFPKLGFTDNTYGYQAPSNDLTQPVTIDPASKRLQVLTPFPAWDGADFTQLRLLIQASGKCTTDHISMAGPWLVYRGHLENISDNFLIGATNRFTGETNAVLNAVTGEYAPVPDTARQYQQLGVGLVVIGDENYGEGSSREHAAMEARFLGVQVVVVRSFARIHETNLKKQGVLALTFANPDDYNRVQEMDRISIQGVTQLSPDQPLTMVAHHADGTAESIRVNHTYNANQIAWFQAGSALNKIRSESQ
jgi:aconitate hydratase